MMMMMMTMMPYLYMYLYIWVGQLNLGAKLKHPASGLGCPATSIPPKNADAEQFKSLMHSTLC